MQGLFQILFNALDQLITELIAYIPNLIIALLIWIIGNFFINVAVKLIEKLKVKGIALEDRAVDALAKIVLILAKFILILTILDYLGIGKEVISAILNSMTFAIAITLGIAFGGALQDDAKNIVDYVKGLIKK